MKISVGIITYNQEKTICQTLDSILCQQGDFDLEVIVGEDHGADGTRAICEEYASRYPSIVRLLPDEPNMGIMANVARVMSAAMGDYIGLIAGDDYWCDEYKLAKQLTYMEEHPDCGVCFTDGFRLLVKQNKIVPGIITHPIADDGDESQYFFNKAYRGGPYLLPLSMLVRRDMMQYIDFDEFIRRQLPVEDYPMQAIWSKHTHFGVLADKTVVYRVYKESATFISFDSPKYLSYHKGLMDTRRYLNELFPQDACFSEEWMQDYEFYKEYLLYLHKWQYKKAKDLIAKHSSDINRTPFPSGEGWGEAQPHYLQAKRMTRNWFRFVAFAIYKELMYIKDIKNRT